MGSFPSPKRVLPGMSFTARTLTAAFAVLLTGHLTSQQASILRSDQNAVH